MKIWVDGGNSKTGEYCIVTEEGNEIRHKEKRSTNNTLEYKAMLAGLELSNDGDIIYSDSKLVVCQLNGWWKINHDHLRELCQKCRDVLEYKNVTVRWIPRKHNRAGRFLNNKKSLQRNARKQRNYAIEKSIIR